MLLNHDNDKGAMWRYCVGHIQSTGLESNIVKLKVRRYGMGVQIFRLSCSHNLLGFLI